MRSNLRVVAFACIAAAGCHASEEERRSMLQSAARANFRNAQDSAIIDLRAPSDSGRNIYFPPIHLSQQTASRAGAEQVWAPFGISTPDTVPPTPRR